MSKYLVDLKYLGIKQNQKNVNYGLTTPVLVQESLKQPWANLVHNLTLSIHRGNTGRQPKDRFIVFNHASSSGVDWSDPGNKDISQEHFDAIYTHVQNVMSKNPLFVQDVYACGNTEYRESVRFVGTEAWQNIFVRNMFYVPKEDDLGDNFRPDLHVLCVPGHGVPAWAVKEYGLNSSDFILLDLERNIILIGGSYYAGEIKKSVFTKLNFALLNRGVLPLHASANVAENGDVSVLLGLSGTGKTTLCMATNRALIGDDEIGCSDSGVFNMEGGCYAKTIDLRQDKEPLIYAAAERANSVAENVTFNQDTRRFDYFDTTLTENGRVSFSMEAIPGAVLSGVGGHPRSIIFLTYDAFGVLPPIARLSREQAGLYYALGYTSKVAGTEKGIKEPVPSFSPLFGGPFYIGHIGAYVDMMMQKLDLHDIPVYLVNTGLSGGVYGTGSRMDINVSRALVAAAQDGVLAGVEYEQDPVFGFDVPRSCLGVNSSILNPKSTWADAEAYDATRLALAEKFIARTNELTLPEEVAACVPVVK